MAVKITSARAILDELNGGKDKNQPWSEIPGYFAMPLANLEVDKVTQAGPSIAMKIFANSRTGEVKSYVAKWIDDNANKLLP